MTFEQLDVFPDPVLDEIVKYFIEESRPFFYHKDAVDETLCKKFKIKKSQLNNIKDKLQSILYNKIKTDLSQNLIDYFSIRKNDILLYNELFYYLNKDYRYVINYGSFIAYISEDKLSNHFEDNDTGDIVEVFDVVEDKVVKFKVTRVVLERIG